MGQIISMKMTLKDGTLAQLVRVASDSGQVAVENSSLRELSSAHMQEAHGVFIQAVSAVEKVNKFESVSEVLNQTSGGLLDMIGAVDNALDELFDTGSLTISVEGKAYVLSLHLEAA